MGMHTHHTPHHVCDLTVSAATIEALGCKKLTSTQANRRQHGPCKEAACHALVYGKRA